MKWDTFSLKRGGCVHEHIWKGCQDSCRNQGLRGGAAHATGSLRIVALIVSQQRQPPSSAHDWPSHFGKQSFTWEVDFWTDYSKINSKQSEDAINSQGFFPSEGFLDNNYIERMDDLQVPCKPPVAQHLRWVKCSICLSVNSLVSLNQIQDLFLKWLKRLSLHTISINKCPAAVQLLFTALQHR